VSRRGDGGGGWRPRRRLTRGGVRRLVGAAWFAAAACRGAAQTSLPGGGGAAPDAAASVSQVRVFLIAPRDGGRTGRQVACGDSAVPIEVTLPQAAPALAGAMRALLAMEERYDRGSGLLNSLYASRLALAGVERQGAQARVLLTGYVELGDACDNARMLAQLTETALQFRGISDVQFELDGQPLRPLLLGTAAPAPPPAGSAPAPSATSPRPPDVSTAPPPDVSTAPPPAPDLSTAPPPGSPRT